jgi:hypothetical protein
LKTPLPYPALLPAFVGKKQKSLTEQYWGGFSQALSKNRENLTTKPARTVVSSSTTNNQQLSTNNYQLSTTK